MSLANRARDTGEVKSECSLPVLEGSFKNRRGADFLHYFIVTGEEGDGFKPKSALF